MVERRCGRSVEKVWTRWRGMEVVGTRCGGGVDERRCGGDLGVVRSRALMTTTLYPSRQQGGDWLAAHNPHTHTHPINNDGSNHLYSRLEYT